MGGNCTLQNNPDFQPFFDCVKVGQFVERFVEFIVTLVL